MNNSISHRLTAWFFVALSILWTLFVPASAFAAITSVSPASGTFGIGNWLPIRWSYTEKSSATKMLISIKRDTCTPSNVCPENGPDFQTLSLATDNDGSEDILVPSNITKATNWRVYVKDTTNTLIYTAASGPITIKDGIRNVGPSSGSFLRGSQIPVTWSYPGATSSNGMMISIKRDYCGDLLCTQGDANWRVLSSSTPNDGTESVPIPVDITAASDWRIYVKDGTNSAIWWSGGLFAIQNAPMAYSASSSSPLSAPERSWFTFTSSWTDPDSQVVDVDIERRLIGTSTWYGTIRMGFAGSSGSTKNFSTGFNINEVGTYEFRYSAKENGQTSRSPWSTGAQQVVVRDVTSPTLTITTPSGDVQTTDSTYTLYGTASDNVAVTNVTWSNLATGGTGSAVTSNGWANWSISNVPLNIGQNVIKVKAVDAASNSSEPTRTITRTIAAPPTPSLPSVVVVGSTEIQVSWSAVSGADKYDLAFASQSGGPYSSLVCGSSTSKSHQGLVSGRTYYYKVMAGSSQATCSDKSTGWSSYSTVTSGATKIPVISSVAPSALEVGIKLTTIDIVGSYFTNSQSGYPLVFIDGFVLQGANAQGAAQAQLLNDGHLRVVVREIHSFTTRNLVLRYGPADADKVTLVSAFSVPTIPTYTGVSIDAQQQVHTLLLRGIISDANDLRGAEAARRAEVATLLYRTVGGGAGADASFRGWAGAEPRNPFSDINQTDYFFKPVLYLAALKYDDTNTVFKRESTFNPAGPMLRSWTVKAMLEAWNIPPLTTAELNAVTTLYSDVAKDLPEAAYIYKARALGLIASNQPTFRPSDNIKREEVFILLYNLLASYVPLNGGQALDANDFVLEPIPQYTLTLTVDPASHGEVRTSLGACSTTCTYSVTEHTPVTVEASNTDPDYLFTGFSGNSGCTVSGRTCSFTMQGNATVQANYTNDRHNLTVNVTTEPLAGGHVYSDPPGISYCRNAGDSCTGPFGGSVTLTLAPAGDSIGSFTSGCNSVSGNTCTVDMSSDRTVQASFKRVPSAPVKIDFDAFPPVSRYSSDGNGRITLKLRVIGAPQGISQIDQIHVDWLGQGQANPDWVSQCNATGYPIDQVITCIQPKAFGTNEIGSRILTVTAYQGGKASNRLYYAYEVVGADDKKRYTGSQNQEHLRKFWTVNPATNKAGVSVNTATGTQEIALSLLKQQGLIDLDLGLRYNSGLSGLAKDSPNKGVLGRGWSHAYGYIAKMDITQAATLLVLHWSNNQEMRFWRSGSTKIYCEVPTANYCPESLHGGQLANHYDQITADSDGYLLVRMDRTQYRFDTSGRLKSSTDRMGRQTLFDYDASPADRLKSVTDPVSGITLGYDYNEDGSLKTVTDKAGNVVTFWYDRPLDLTRIVLPDGNYYRMEPDANGQILEYFVSESGSDVLRYFKNEFDDKGRIWRQTNANGKVTRFEYDESTIDTIITTTVYPNGRIAEDVYNTNYQLLRHSILNDPDHPLVTHYEYTRSGLLRRVTEPAGTDAAPVSKVTENTYTDKGQIALVSTYRLDAPLERFVRRMEYENDNLKRSFDENDAWTEYQYEADRDAKWVGKPVGNYLVAVSKPYENSAGFYLRHQTDYTNRFHNLDAGNGSIYLDEVIRTVGGQQYTTVNQNGRVFKKVDAEGVETHVDYNDLTGNPEAITIYKSGAAYSTTRMEYTALGLLKRQTDAEGNVSCWQYSAWGAVRREVSPLHSGGNCDNLQLKRATVYEYEGTNVVRVIQPDGGVIQYQYNSMDQRTVTIDSESVRTEQDYDHMGRVRRIYDAAARISKSFGYDRTNRLTEEYEHPAGDATRTLVRQRAYDFRGNLVSDTDLLGDQARTTTITPDAAGRTLSITDANRKITVIDRYLNGEIRSVTNAAGHKAEQEFDDQDRIHVLQDPNANRTGFERNGEGAVRLESPSTNESIQHEFNVLKAIEKTTPPRGDTREYYYYLNGWPKSVSFDGKTWTYTHDPLGQTKTITGTDGSLITYTHDPVSGRTTGYTDVRGRNIGYQHYLNGKLKTLTYPNGKAVNYHYDGDGRLWKVVDWSGRTVIEYLYTIQGRLSEERRQNGVVRTYTYTKGGGRIGELKSITDTAPGGAEVLYIELGYDLLGNITSEKMRPAASAEALGTPAVAMTYTPGNDNRVETYNGTQLRYHPGGALAHGPLGEQFVDFTYDARERLTKAGNMEMTYDVEDHLLEMRVGQNTRSFVVNPQAGYPQVLMETDFDGTERMYLYGNGLIAHDVGGVRVHYHADTRGSTVALTDGQGAVTDRFHYLPYGAMAVREGNTVTPFQFVGKFGVMALGHQLHKMGVRYYLTDLGRFISKDALIGFIDQPITMNRYQYAANDPVGLIDPSGYAPDNPIYSNSPNACMLDDAVSLARPICMLPEQNFHEIPRSLTPPSTVSSRSSSSISGSMLSKIAAASAHRAYIFAATRSRSDLLRNIVVGSIKKGAEGWKGKISAGTRAVSASALGYVGIALNLKDQQIIGGNTLYEYADRCSPGLIESYGVISTETGLTISRTGNQVATGLGGVANLVISGLGWTFSGGMFGTELSDQSVEMYMRIQSGLDEYQSNVNNVTVNNLLSTCL